MADLVITDPPIEDKRVLTGAEYITLAAQSTPWIVKNIVPVGGSVLIYGSPKVGKSYSAIQLALSIQGGGNWMGFRVERPGPVVYIQFDTPRPLWSDRQRQLRASGLTGIDTLLNIDRESLDTFPFDILSPPHLVLLRSALRQVAPSAVIIDTIREAHSGDENDSTVMRNVVAGLSAATYPAAMILVSHSRKPSAEVGPDIMADNRGSNYVVGRMDTIIRFTKKSLHYSGRSIEEGSLKIERMDNGLWEVAGEESHDGIIAEVMADPSLDSIRAKARALAIRLSKSEESARSLIRRFEG